ncbi:hypothetical protein D5086_004682 [Populus alba]|uniref:Uncharacterized protein n=1 Tax=Populus alba TaxID=43335 RepID=A0ACC4CR60_POPAL
MIRCDAKFLPSRDARSGKQERVKSILLAQKEAFGECIDLELVGNVKGAQASTRQQGNKDSGISTNEETSGLVDDAPDEEDDGQRKRKRVQSKEGVDQAGLYQAHPLKIILHIFDDEIIVADSGCPALFKEHLHMVHLPYELLGYLNANLLGKSTATNSLLIVLIVLFVSNVVLVSLLKDYKFMFPVGVLQVNLYILKLLPLDQENHVLAHQVHCLAVLFEYFIDEASPSAKCSSAVDVGLCKPVSDEMITRNYCCYLSARGRIRYLREVSLSGMARLEDYWFTHASRETRDQPNFHGTGIMIIVTKAI